MSCAQPIRQHADALPGLIQQCQDLYLLTELRPTPYGDLAGQDHVHRLAHDTLALVVRQRYGESDLPGQRARRILENAVMGADQAVAGAPPESSSLASQPPEAKKPTVLSEADLATVEAGERGMRVRSEAEERLVTASRQARDRNRRIRRTVIGSFIGLGILIAIVAVFALWQRNVARQKQNEAEREARHAQAGELAVHAQNAIANNRDDPSLALLLAIDAVEVTWRAPEKSVTVNAYKVLIDAVDKAPPYVMTLPRHRHTDSVTSAAYSPDGTQIVTASDDQTARIWDAATGQEVRTLSGHTDRVNSAAYSPDGKHDRHRQCRRDRPHLGRRHGAGSAHPQRPHRRGQVGGLQSGRQADRHRQCRPDRPHLGRGHGAGSAHPQRPHRLGQVGGLQSGRQADRHRQWRPDRPHLGRGHGAGSAPPQRPHRLGHSRRPTVRTASRSSPPVPTRPPASGTPPRGRKCAHLSGHTDCGHVGGLQSGRQADRHRQ